MIKKSLFYKNVYYKIVNLFSCSSNSLQIFFINPTFFNFLNFFLLQILLLLSKIRQKHINKKRQNPYQDITSGFTSANALYSSQKISKASTLSQVDADPTSNIVSSSQMSSKIQEKLNFYRQKAVVFNTEKSTRIWMKNFVKNTIILHHLKKY